MWSVGVHGRKSAFLEQQRLLFSIGGCVSEDDRARQRQLLMELTTLGNCRAVVVERLEDREALLATRAAIQQACVGNSLLSRAHFVVMAMTPVDCRLEEIAARVEQALTTLQVQRLDMLLLQAQSLPGTSGLHARKQVVLEAWEHMIAIQQVGLVQHIGVSDLSVQDVDFLLTAYPSSLPLAWSIEVQLSSSDVDVPIEDVAEFAHAHGIDMIARFQFNHLNSLEPQDKREDWHVLTQNLAERYRERPFKFLVAHENEGTAASYHMESHALADTNVMQTPLQIFVRYLLQKGFVVVPQGSDDSLGIEDEEATIRELFGPLAHPFTAIHPSCSPHKLHSSLLTQGDLTAIDHTMPLTTSFPLPAPPRTPISTTGRSRPGSTQERRITLPVVVSRPPTAD